MTIEKLIACYRSYWQRNEAYMYDDNFQKAAERMFIKHSLTYGASKEIYDDIIRYAGGLKTLQLKQ